MTTETVEKNDYYYINGERIPLLQEPAVYAVKFAHGERSDSPNISRRCSRLLREDSKNIYFIPNYGIQIYQARPQTSRSEAEKEKSVTNLKRAVRELDHESSVEYATPAFRRSKNSGELMYVSNHFMVQFKPEVTRQQIDEFNASHGVTMLEELGYCNNGYLLQAPEGNGSHNAVALANEYYESGLCVFATPDFIRKTHFRHATPKLRVYEIAKEFGLSNEALLDILHELHIEATSHMSTVDEAVRSLVADRLSNDTRTVQSKSHTDMPPDETPTERTVGERSVYLNEQWHLTTAKVTDAWSNVTRGNASINICIMDDGIDVDHAEFSNKVTKQYDFAANVENARPKTADDNHGTACAGVAVAKGQKAFGAAPECKLIAIRTPNYLGNADEAQMFRRAVDWGADVISCSWGPADGNGTIDPLPDATRAAINHCVTAGRGSKGIPVFWAAGNGNESVSLDGYASNPDVIAVAASTNNETRSWYSDYGKEIWICAPSSGDGALGERRIFTVDRTGNAGYNSGDSSLGDAGGDYTNNFGGTSSATPLVAGIAGLMLSTCPDLTHQQVRNILKDTADKIGGSSSYDSNGHNHEFGYGRVNALEAARRAQSHSTSGTSTSTSTTTGPSISGPSSYSRSSGAPTFQISTGSNPYYHVEITNRPELFDKNAHESERDSSNFYASYQDGGKMTASSYTLPDSTWNNLKHSDRLYFRIFTSEQLSGWVNYEVSTPSAQASSAPAMQLSGVASRTVGNRTPMAARSNQPTIYGPESYDRGAISPSFSIDTGDNGFYAVEIASDTRLFDTSQNSSERADDNFYASWEDGGVIASNGRTMYTLPTHVWKRLRDADRLYYRAIFASSKEEWNDVEYSTTDEKYDDSPWISLSGGITQRLELISPDIELPRYTLDRTADERLWLDR